MNLSSMGIFLIKLLNIYLLLPLPDPLFSSLLGDSAFRVFCGAGAFSLLILLLLDMVPDFSLGLDALESTWFPGLLGLEVGAVLFLETEPLFWDSFRLPDFTCTGSLEGPCLFVLLLIFWFSLVLPFPDSDCTLGAGRLL